MSALSQRQIQDCRKQLQDRETELHKTIHAALVNADNKTYAEVAGRVLDIGEQSLADVLADFHIIELEKEVAELAEVEAALARIQAGTYGECVDCGADIAADRMHVHPAATRCTGCQMRYERRGKDMSPSL